MRQTLQKLFEWECRNYAFYLQEYESIEKQYDTLETRKDEIEQNKKREAKVREVATLLKSAEFIQEKDKMDLPQNFAEFEKAFSEYKVEDVREEIKYLYKQEEWLEALLEKLRSKLRDSENVLFSYIDMAFDKGIKFLFPKNNKTAVRIFILYYCDSYNYKYRRNVIEPDKCKLNKTFMKAYLNTLNPEHLNANKWFEEKARKYKDF